MPDRYPLRLGPFVVAVPLVQEAVPEIGLAYSRRGGRVRPCLLKHVRLASRDSEDLEAAFARASRVSRRLIHPQLASAFAVGRLEGRMFLAEDCVDGRLLAQLPRRPMAPRAAATIAHQLAGALAFLHGFEGAGLAHRRLGPEQVHLGFDGSVRLLDSPFSGSTRAGDPPFPRAMRPSPRHLPPEIEAGEPGDARSDLYMLGALLWEMLSGRAFERPTGEAGRALLLSLPPEVAAGLRELLGGLLSPAPRDRPASAEEAAARLAPFVPWRPGRRLVVARLLAGAADVGAERQKWKRWRQEAQALLPRPLPEPSPRPAPGHWRSGLSSLLSWPRRLAVPALVGAAGMTALLFLWQASPAPPAHQGPLANAPLATPAPVPPPAPAPAPSAEPEEPPLAPTPAPRPRPPRAATPAMSAPAEARARGDELLKSAEVRFQWRDFEGAERLVRQALLEMPDRPRPHYLLGLVLLARGEAADAAAAFARAIEIQPGYEDAARKLKIAQERASIR